MSFDRVVSDLSPFAPAALKDGARRATQAVLGVERVLLDRLKPGCATLWRGRDDAGRSVVIKLRQGRPDRVVREADWLENERRLTAWANAQGLCSRRVLGAGSHISSSPLTWIAFDYLDGETAADACSSWQQALAIAEDVLAVLRSLHSFAPEQLPIHPSVAQAATLPETFLIETGHHEIAHAIGAAVTAHRLLMPCHGDAAATNIVVSAAADGKRSAELIDWGAGRLHNPSLDLASVFVWLSRWRKLAESRVLLRRCLEPYADLQPAIAEAFPAFLARSCLVRAPSMGAAWAQIARRTLVCTDAEHALRTLYGLVDRREKQHDGATGQEVSISNRER